MGVTQETAAEGGFDVLRGIDLGGRTVGDDPAANLPETLALVRAAAAGGAEPENELLEDNDSIEYDEDEWGAQDGGSPVEEDYINDDTDSNGD